MRSILAAIAAALSRLAVTTSRWVHRAGWWVLELGDIGGSPAPAPPVALPRAEAIDDVTAILRVAGILAQRKAPQPSDLRGITDAQLRWLRELDRLQLCRVIAADPDRVRMHLLSRQYIRG